MSKLRENLDFLATLFFEAGVTNWVVSPGSRNAPIVAGFIRHGGFSLHSFPDERAAAFVAMGLSLSQNYPCGVICTSGTAAANFYPAVCESFYQRVPLIVLTADRPEHLIDQWDGQTIHQSNLYKPHIRGSFNINANEVLFDSLESTLFEAAKLSQYPVSGPVHINIALDDPIYEGLESDFNEIKPQKPFIFHHQVTPPVDAKAVKNAVAIGEIKQPKILVVVGQHAPSESLSHALSLLQNKVPVLCDICSHQLQYGIDQWDLALTTHGFDNKLLPDILVTVGMSTISKALKRGLLNANVTHLHITEHGEVGNPFGTKPTVLNYHDADFLTALYLHSDENSDYLNYWKSYCGSIDISKFKQNYLNEFQIVKTIINASNENISLHFGNSMSIRYASWNGKANSKIFGNRGTSGIDGSLSTAVGYAIGNATEIVVSILGDISFIYDAHGLWTNKLPSNLKIIVLNNNGGQIFNWIDGPSKEPKLKPFIETPQSYNLSDLCAFYKIKHQTLSELNNNGYLEFINSNIQCLEIKTVS